MNWFVVQINQLINQMMQVFDKQNSLSNIFLMYLTNASAQDKFFSSV